MTLVFTQGAAKNVSAGLHNAKQGSSQSIHNAGIFEQDFILQRWPSHSISYFFDVLIDSISDNAIVCALSLFEHFIDVIGYKNEVVSTMAIVTAVNE